MTTGNANEAANVGTVKAQPSRASVSGYDALVTDLEIVKQKLESIRSNLSDNPADAEYQANDDVWWAIQSVDNAIGNLRAS